jgi:Protein of unknown function DUF262
MEMRSEKRALDKMFKRRDRYEIPDWQRDEVWELPRKQLLIDSILRGWRLPKFYFVQSSKSPESFEVVDGQQRLAAIFEFMSNDIKLSAEGAKKFKGSTYAELPPDTSDLFDDFEIDYDEIVDATQEDLTEFFQRLQSGMSLNSSEKLNAISSNLRDFCRSLVKHEFFSKCVTFNNTRYAHFDVVAKVAAIEVDGMEAGLRLDDITKIFKEQKSFSPESKVAVRIKAALDFLAKCTPVGATYFRNRSTTQSFITLVCSLLETASLEGKETDIAAFAERFSTSLSKEVDMGQKATDEDLILYQKSINANVKTGASTRHKILEKKLLLWNPGFYGDSNIAPLGAGLAFEISKLAKSVVSEITIINASYSAQTGKDYFKATNKTATAMVRLGEPVTNYDEYKLLVEDLYFLLWEGPGSKLTDKPTSFSDINILRTEEEHDVDHGDASKVKKKKLDAGIAFAKYSGMNTPVACGPDRFPLFQRNLLDAICVDLGQLRKTLAG